MIGSLAEVRFAIKFLPSQPGFEYLAMSEPYLKKGCHRVGYVQFKEGTDVRGVLNAIDRTEVGRRGIPLKIYLTSLGTGEGLYSAHECQHIALFVENSRQSYCFRYLGANEA